MDIHVILRMLWSRCRASKSPALDVPIRFTLKELDAATSDFNESSKLGWAIYRGHLASGAKVAVKKVARKSKQGRVYFSVEMSVLSGMRHRNLVNLVGWCRGRSDWYLVYEFVPNGNLSELLFNSAGVLSWARRLNILRGVAAALTYLHEGYTERVIHRDIKTSNVFLDENFMAKVSGFGLARKSQHSQSLPSTTIAGTVGYIAPEVLGTGKFNTKTDVFAFGAVILEVTCGRKPVDRVAQPEQMILVDWVWDCHARGDILTAVDSRLEDNFPENEVLHVLLIGLLCCHPDSGERPSARQVENFLQGPITLPLVPRIKPISAVSWDALHPED